MVTFNDADDLYALLGVPATATVEEIRNGYKEKALLHHPDRGGDPFAWTRIAQAYDTLNGPRRAAYDKTRRVATGGAESEFAQSFGDGAFDLTEGKVPAERKAEKASTYCSQEPSVRSMRQHLRHTQRLPSLAVPPAHANSGLLHGGGAGVTGGGMGWGVGELQAYCAQCGTNERRWILRVGHSQLVC